MERRTLPGEPESTALGEVEEILNTLSREDATFRARASAMFSRPAYEIPDGHELPQLLASALTQVGHAPAIIGASFWTDAAVLGHAGIPSILFGPGGAGLHSTDEYVNLDDVLVCRDALVEIVRRFCNPG
jgi:acetylornithine deacetylase